MPGAYLGFGGNDSSIRRVDLIADVLRVLKIKIQQAQRIELRLSVLRSSFKAEPVLIAETAEAERLIRADRQRCRRLHRIVQLMAISVQHLHGHCSLNTQ